MKRLAICAELAKIQDFKVSISIAFISAVNIVRRHLKGGKSLTAIKSMGSFLR
jgi:hypothetical protein